MKTPKVSIIIPIYKAEASLRKCLDSFVCQTLLEWEAILVDDGSPDACGQICDEYAAKDGRFRVIHQQNAGVSAARQTGLDAVKGEYVIHADPDDWVEPTMLEELYRKAKEDDADMMICDFYNDVGNKSIYSKQCPSLLDATTVLKEMFVSIHGSCCNKLVKRSCVEHCMAKFPKDINFCEDVCFIIQLLKHNIKISYLNKAFYHYVQSPTSLTNRYTQDLLESLKRYTTFLIGHFPEDSFPVMQSKEWTKKTAFLYADLSKEELDKLYPEITSVHEGNLINRLMYRLAFTGHHFLAGQIRKLKMTYINKIA